MNDEPNNSDYPLAPRCRILPGAVSKKFFPSGLFPRGCTTPNYPLCLLHDVGKVFHPSPPIDHRPSADPSLGDSGIPVVLWSPLHPLLLTYGEEFSWVRCIDPAYRLGGHFSNVAWTLTAVATGLIAPTRGRVS